VPLDESLVQVAIDLGGRPYATIDLPFAQPAIGGLTAALVPHFLESFANQGRLSLHVRLLAGENDHHRLEAAFKALARALSDAVMPDSRYAGEAPSTKGVL
jgi:imidazoleglycerol-phosphate dehydratase